MPPEPEVLFSPLPPEKPAEPEMVGQRGDNSALFDLSRLDEFEAKAKGKPERDDGSGLVVIEPPSKESTSNESSGLVRVQDLADLEKADAPETPVRRAADPLSSLKGAPFAAPSTETAESTDVPPPTVSHNVLYAILGLLFLTVVGLAWKILA